MGIARALGRNFRESTWSVVNDAYSSLDWKSPDPKPTESELRDLDLVSDMRDEVRDALEDLVSTDAEIRAAVYGQDLPEEFVDSVVEVLLLLPESERKRIDRIRMAVRDSSMLRLMRR